MAVGSIIARIITQYSDKGSKAAQRDINKLGKQFDDFSKRVFKAFAVAGAAAGAFAVKIGKDAVQAAMEDQKSQLLLANALRNTVGATDENIVATEAYISAMQRQFAIADDDLRPSLAALAAVTGDLAEAQALQNIAIDVAAGTGKDLASVTQAIVKAYQGNLGALRRLGVPLEENIVKSKDFNGAMQALASTFAGAGSTSANTFAGQLRGLQLTYGEIIEELGYALIPVLQNLAVFVREEILPALEAWVRANKDQVATSLQSVIDGAISAGKAIARFFGFISDNIQVIKNFGAILFGIFVGTKVFSGITAMVAAIGVLRSAFYKQAAAAGTAAVATAAATGGTSLIAATAGIVAFTAATGVALASLNKMGDETEKTVKSATNLREHMARVETTTKKTATTTGTIFNFTNKTTAATKKLSAEEQKRLDIKKAIAKANLDEFGIKNISTTDPVSLEAARLNLIKEGNLQEIARLNAITLANAQLAEANLLASRYADILAVINDRQVSPQEVATLAAKWNESEQAVIKYLSQVTKAPLPTGWDDPGKNAASGWNDAIVALNNYYKTLTGAPIPTLPSSPGITAPTGPQTPLQAAQQATDELIAFLDIFEPGWEKMDLSSMLPSAPVIDSLESSISNPSLNAGLGFGMGAPVTVLVTGTGGLSDETKKEVVNAVVEASGSGYSTNWYRTTNRVAL